MPILQAFCLVINANCPGVGGYDFLAGLEKTEELHNLAQF